MSSPDITLYTFQTSNGMKPTILLEELRLPYKVRVINLRENVQKQPWFLEINPNGRIPALADRSFGGGSGIQLFESGSILQYLAETYDTENKLSYPHGTREYWEVQQWVFFQNAGIGPMQGQASHFLNHPSEKIPYAIKRYSDETKRLYSVLENRLSTSASGYLVGDRLTIADITTYGSVKGSGYAGISLDEFPNLSAWLEKLGKREGFQRGVDEARFRDNGDEKT